MSYQDTFATKALHAGQDPLQWNCRAVVPPIVLATTYKQRGPALHDGHEYSRCDNPTRTCLQECLAAIENAKYALAFSSGLATTAMITHLLKAGEHFIAMDDLYGGTNRYFSNVAGGMNIESSFVDMTDPQLLHKAIKPNTKMIWLETPTNPTMKIVDIKAVCEVVHQHPGVNVVVDNTFMSSYFQQPLSLGADIVMHSITKYLNGHSDVIMGCVMTNNDDLYKRLKFLQYAVGAVPSAFDSYLVNRSLKTLHLRMQEHMKNGMAVAKFLEKHPAVEKVLHPGLPSHPQHALAMKQCQGFSGMVTFYIKGGKKEATAFLNNIKVFTLAESLGGFESLAELPSVMTHASVPPDMRDKLGISDTLIRLSVGLESTQDLLDDLDKALNIAVK